MKLRFLKACLLATIVSLVAAPAFAADGFATINGDTTGGAGGPIVTVGTAEGLRAFATNPAPLIILVSGTINLGPIELEIGSNKTIMGIGRSPTVIGEMEIDGRTNVVIHNLFIENDGVSGTGDGVRVIGASEHVWVDHCTFTDCADGSVDITQASDLITVSWCKFSYTRDNGHNFVNLIGSNDSDSGNYRLTYHHNWWSTLCKQRMPSQRFGECHVYNNYFNCVSNQHCTAVRLQAEMRSENNFYDTVINPIFKFLGDTGQQVFTSGNTYSNCAGTIDPGTGFGFFVPYAYTLDATANIPSIVMNGAGAHSSLWFTADAGRASVGGAFMLRGAIGQPDAGVLQAGDFSMRGGFLARLVALQTPGAPLLRITTTGTNTAIVSWPSPSTDFALQQNTDLTSTNWTAPSETIVDNGTTKFIIVNPPAANRFYRLFKP